MAKIFGHSYDSDTPLSGNMKDSNPSKKAVDTLRKKMSTRVRIPSARKLAMHDADGLRLTKRIKR